MMNAIRMAVVVGSNPGDHSLDLVMLDDGARIVGAQLMSLNGSGRTGTFDMPAVPARRDKWDISEETDQDQIALVSYVRNRPVVLGFIYPQVNQINRKSGKTMSYRHQSDVQVRIDEKGAISINHPGGLAITVGTPDATGAAPDGVEDGEVIDRNTGEKPDFRITIGDFFELHVDKEGHVKLTTAKGIDFKCDDPFTVESPSIVFKTALVDVQGGDVTVSGDVTASGVSLVAHVHSGVTPGGATTGPPA